MKNFNLFIGIICSTWCFSQVGITTATPQSVLDVTSANSVADPLSIGSGYVIKIKSDTPLDATISSITRVSQEKD